MSAGERAERVGKRPTREDITSGHEQESSERITKRPSVRGFATVMLSDQDYGDGTQVQDMEVM